MIANTQKTAVLPGARTGVFKTGQMASGTRRNAPENTQTLACAPFPILFFFQKKPGH